MSRLGLAMLTFLFLACCVPDVGNAQTRTWRLSDGGALTAELVGVEDDIVKLKLGGKVLNFNLKELSEADREFVETWKKKQPKPPVIPKDLKNVARTWTDMDGNTVEGFFLLLRDGEVTILKPDGKTEIGQLTKFSKADQTLIRQLHAAGIAPDLAGLKFGGKKLDNPGKLPIEPDNPLAGKTDTKPPSRTGNNNGGGNKVSGGPRINYGGNDNPRNSGGGVRRPRGGSRSFTPNQPAGPVSDVKSIRPATMSERWSGKIMMIAILFAAIGGGIFVWRKIQDNRERTYAGDLEDGEED